MSHPFDLDTFTAAYIEAIYFTDTGEDDQPAADSDMDPEGAQRCRDECAAFLWKAYPFLDHAAAATDESPDSVYERAAHDFWFTRNGHGVGFWDDSRWPVASDTLDRIAKGFGNVDAYETDSGTLDVM